MPEYRHPRTLDDVDGHPASAVTLGGESVPVTGGTLECDERDARALADAHGVPVADLRVSEAPAPLGGDAGDMIDDGVCPWCSDYEGEHVGQHASSAHPDLWSDYTDGQ